MPFGLSLRDSVCWIYDIPKSSFDADLNLLSFIIDIFILPSVCILPLVCSLQSAFYPQSAVCSLHFTPGLQSEVCVLH